MELIKALQWRYATKKFDSSRKVKSSDISIIKESIRLSASSFGLQIYKALIINENPIRERLREVSWGQSQITDASHLFIFCGLKNITDRHVDSIIEMKSEINKDIPKGNLKDYGKYIKKYLSRKTPEELSVWSSRQIYIALGNLLSCCGELKIDACPIEGFEAKKYDEILGLSDKNLESIVIAAVGYRSPQDETQYHKKTRRLSSELFEEL